METRCLDCMYFPEMCEVCKAKNETRRAKQKERNKRNAANRKVREDILKSLGLVKVRGNLGGVYWE